MDPTAARLATWAALCNVGKIQQPAEGQIPSGLVSSGELASASIPPWAERQASAQTPAVGYENVPFLTPFLCIGSIGRERNTERQTLLSHAASRVTQDYAAAEKDICDDVGIALAAVIRAAETTHGVFINELRVTMLDDGTAGRWVQAVCTIAR